MPNLTPVLARVLRHLPAAASDADLLRAYGTDRDPDAFRALVARHGPMVLGVCRRVLNQSHAAEDAFQATFLVLARRVTAVRRPEGLAAWLFGVARRVALNARTADRRRARRETRTRPVGVATEPFDELTARELLAALDAEVGRLPAGYREPLVLCYWQGLTQAEVARRLGWSAGMVKGRLERGRARLAGRMRARGFGPECLLLAAAAAAAVPADLLARTADLVTVPFARTIPTAVLALAAGPPKLLPAVALSPLVTAGMIGLAACLLRPVEPPDAAPPASPPAGTQSSPSDADPLPPQALFRAGTVRFRHPSNANGLALSADGKLLATHGSGVVRVWDTATGKQVQALTEQRRAGGFFAGEHILAFAADGRRLLVAADNGAVHDYDLATAVPRSVPLGGSDRVHSVHPSPDGRLVAVGTASGAELVDRRAGRAVARVDNADRQRPPRPGQPQDRLLFHGAYCLSVFSPDGGTWAVNVSGEPTVVRLCDPATGAERRRIDLADRLVRLAFAPDGKRVAVTERDNAVRIYDTATGRRVREWVVRLTNPTENYTSDVAVSPDGNLVAAGATDHLIHLWDVDADKELRTFRGHTWNVSGVAFAPDGRTLYSASWDGTVRRWDVNSGQERPVADGATGVMARSAAGAGLATAGDGGLIHLWETVRFSRLRTLAGHPDGHSRLAFSPDGKRLAAAGADLSIRLWGVAGGSPVRQWSWPKGTSPHTEVDEMTFSPDGTTLATVVFRANQVLLWDAATGERKLTLPHQMVRSCAFMPDGGGLVTVGWDRAVRQWNLPAGTERDATVLPQPDENRDGPREDSRVESVAVAPGGWLLATIHLDSTVRVWDSTSGRVLQVIRQDTREAGRITSYGSQGRGVAFSPDGLWLATVGYGSVVRLLDPRTGKPVLERRGHTGRAFLLDFHGDGRTLASGGSDNTVLLWTLRPDGEAGPDPWADLAAADPAVAYRAVWALAADPAKAVAVLRPKLSPAVPVDADRVRQWIADLDGDEFVRRTAASRELAKIAEPAEALLRKAVAAAQSPEQRRRLTELLDGLDRTRPSAVREGRAVVALAWAGTAEARELLEALAAGDASARLTREARASLERLQGR